MLNFHLCRAVLFVFQNGFPHLRFPDNSFNLRQICFDQLFEYVLCGNTRRIGVMKAEI